MFRLILFGSVLRYELLLAVLGQGPYEILEIESRMTTCKANALTRWTVSSVDGNYWAAKMSGFLNENDRKG